MLERCYSNFEPVKNGVPGEYKSELFREAVLRFLWM